MGVILVAGIFSALVSLVLLACVRTFLRYCGQDKHAEPVAAAVAAVFFIVAWAPVVLVIDAAATRTEIGLSGREADKFLAEFGVPPNTATDVCWRLNPRGQYADFKMAEPAFLDWMNSQGWETKAFSSSEEGDLLTSASLEVYPVREFESRQWHEVLNGYVYYDCPDGDPDNSTRVVYDRIGGRVYIMR